MANSGIKIRDLDSATLASLRYWARPYITYTAFMTQSGTTNPVPIELENTIGNIVWTRISGGTYLITSTTGEFTEGNTTVLFSESYLYGTGVTYMETQWVSASGITVTTKDVNLNLSDELISNMVFEIRVYLITPPPSPSPSVTPTVTPTPSITPTVTPSVTPSITPSISVSPSVTPSITPSTSVVASGLNANVAFGSSSVPGGWTAWPDPVAEEIIAIGSGSIGIFAGGASSVGNTNVTTGGDTGAVPDQVMARAFYTTAIIFIITGLDPGLSVTFEGFSTGVSVDDAGSPSLDDARWLFLDEGFAVEGNLAISPTINNTNSVASFTTTPHSTGQYVIQISPDSPGNGTAVTSIKISQS